MTREEDCISRQAVLEIFGYVMSYWTEHAIDVEPHEIKDAIIEQYTFTAEELSKLPSVTPQTKMGHWIENASEWQNIDPPYICSECGNFHLRKTNYCDQCGAKMEGV